MDRVEELEARLAWYEKQMADLDAVVQELAVEVVRLRREVDTLVSEREPTVITGGHEPPPHY